MPDYKNGKIYKLWSPEGDEIYIGSTTESLSRRKAKHKSQSDGCATTSKILFDKYTDVRIELLEEVSCDNKEQLIKKEGEYIRNNNCVNKVVPGRTNKEWCEDNKEHLKQYYENNKEHISQQQKNHYENNKEHISQQHKQYYENTKEQKYQKAKEKILTEIVCECGRTIIHGGKARHLKTKIHNDLIKELK